ncbi:MAG TPA: CDP-alcohol phosphatidyltransferase family protein [Gemmatimonadota bacterium]|nr:CDP-alcohol phosphatidyltransferase family protein [Gemmatimonadota bacterium]
MTARDRLPERVEGLRIATLPNLVSLVRLLLVVPILLLLARSEPASDRVAILVLLVAGATDLLDGLLARRRGSISPSGKLFDPIADKVLIGGLVIYLAVARDFPWWLVAAILARDLALVMGAVLFFRRDRVVFGANWSGKLTTFCLGFLILAYLLRWEGLYLPFTAAAVTALALSYVSYGRRAWSHGSSDGVPAGGPGGGMADSAPSETADSTGPERRDRRG